ncbi:MAG: class I SAM-dependent methyltransferase [Anaerolineae bacterium]|nr:class I SAM-dependent methyltransferase [Anaerolineae bacterium]MDW8102174.1 class I SAM-dependent methyltransferase [Anaerolineae bacterium]
MERILDVGCGKAKQPGAIGLDINPLSDADVIADLNHCPWPFASNSFDRILCRHIVEHVADLVGFMEEIHRVARPGALVEIITPHFSNRYSFTDPTHLRHLGWHSFDYFAGGKTVSRPNLLQRWLETQHPIPGFYTAARFRIRNRYLYFSRPYRWAGIGWIANRFPDFYELYLAFIFPARDLYVTLEVVK